MQDALPVHYVIIQWVDFVSVRIFVFVCGFKNMICYVENKPWHCTVANATKHSQWTRSFVLKIYFSCLEQKPSLWLSSSPCLLLSWTHFIPYEIYVYIPSYLKAVLSIENTGSVAFIV